MFYINVWLTVKKAEDAGQVSELLSQAADLSRGEPGCERFEVYHSQNDANRFLLVERWSSQAAWEEHKRRQAVTEIYVPRVLPLVDREPHISSLVSG